MGNSLRETFESEHEIIKLRMSSNSRSLPLVALVTVALGIGSATAHAQCSATLDCSLALTYDHESGRSMSYRLILPLGHDQPGATYPLILFLHGSGERGRDNSRQVRLHVGGLVDATQTEEFGAFLLAPQLPSGSTFWGASDPSDLTKFILDEVISNYAVDTTRLYITGLSLGGYGTIDYTLQYPDLFAAAVPMSGARGNIGATLAERIKDIPFWLFHGRQDRTVPISASQQFVASLEAVGGDPRFTTVEGGHAIWSPIYSDWQTSTHGLYPWLFSQSTVPEPAALALAMSSVLSMMSFRIRGDRHPYCS